MISKLEFLRKKVENKCIWNLNTISKCILLDRRHKPFSTGMLVVLHLVVISVLMCSSRVQGAYRYSLESCSDLIPKLVADKPDNFQVYEPGNPYEHRDHHQQQPTPSWQKANGFERRIKRENFNEPSFRLTVSGKRYRRNSDLYVQIEVKGYYTALMLQGRAVNEGGGFINGGVGLLGRFDPDKIDHRNFSYLECFRQPHSTIVDNGYSKLGNVTFAWTPPDDDKGNIRFVAGITRGGQYWILTSSILHFNPFPISTVQCGGQEACFRVCPLDSNDMLCSSNDAILMYNYNTDLLQKREVEFTLGGRLSSSKTSYIAVVYAEDNENLYQADVTICYMEHGKAQVGHFYLEVVGAPLIQHTDEINIVDYDYDGNMLWCRYRRPISHVHTAVINPYKSYYTLLYKGELNPLSYPKFQTPSRNSMYSSDAKLNLSTPINIYSGSPHVSFFISPLYVIFLQVIASLKVYMNCL